MPTDVDHIGASRERKVNVIDGTATFGSSAISLKRNLLLTQELTVHTSAVLSGVKKIPLLICRRWKQTARSSSFSKCRAIKPAFSTTMRHGCVPQKTMPVRCGATD